LVENGLESTPFCATTEFIPSARHSDELGHATASRLLLAAGLAPTLVPCSTPSELHASLAQVAANDAAPAMVNVVEDALSLVLRNDVLDRNASDSCDDELVVEHTEPGPPLHDDGTSSSPTDSQVALESQESEVIRPPVATGESLGR
jgi:hypothetical protein